MWTEDVWKNALDNIARSIAGARVVDDDATECGRNWAYVFVSDKVVCRLASALSTTVENGINGTPPSQSLSVASVAGFPTSGKVVVLDEIISYTGLDTQNNLLTGITRGVDGTQTITIDSGLDVGRLDTADGYDFVQATYGYDPNYLDWMTSLTDALGHTTYYEYYPNGKLKATCYPDNKGEMYIYDNNNSGNNMITKEYGTFSGTYPQTFAANSDLTVNYSYDANNRLINTYH